jgi:hypothetical protein
VNPIAARDNTIVTLYLNDEECGSERLAPYSDLHRDDASGLHWVTPHIVKHQVGLHDLITVPSKLLEDGVCIRLTIASPLMSILENGFPSL